MVERGRYIVEAAGRCAGHGVEPVRPGSARYRTEPAIAHAKVLRQVVVNRYLLGGVVTHDNRRVCYVRMRGGKVLNEATVFVRELLRNTPSVVTGVLRPGECCPLERLYLTFLAVVPVEEMFVLRGLHAVDIVALQLEVAQHLVERSILQHKYDEVLSFVQVVLYLI